jgi:hypothetical protein
VIGVDDYPEDESPFGVFEPHVFQWKDWFSFETYIIQSYNAPFTPLLGVACAWDWDGEYEESEIKSRRM